MSQTDSFAAWYSLYPRKVARKAAEKAWARCATSPEVIEQIMAGLRAQLPAMLSQERKFVPYPATWLNQQRFEDEQEPAKIRPRVIQCQKCCDSERILVGPPVLEIRKCSCVAGDRIIVLSQIHPEDWSAYEHVTVG